MKIHTYKGINHRVTRVSGISRRWTREKHPKLTTRSIRSFLLTIIIASLIQLWRSIHIVHCHVSLPLSSTGLAFPAHCSGRNEHIPMLMMMVLHSPEIDNQQTTLFSGWSDKKTVIVWRVEWIFIPEAKFKLKWWAQSRHH